MNELFNTSGGSNTFSEGSKKQKKRGSGPGLDASRRSNAAVSDESPVTLETDGLEKAKGKNKCLCLGLRFSKKSLCIAVLLTLIAVAALAAALVYAFVIDQPPEDEQTTASSGGGAAGGSDVVTQSDPDSPPTSPSRRSTHRY